MPQRKGGKKRPHCLVAGAGKPAPATSLRAADHRGARPTRKKRSNRGRACFRAGQPCSAAQKGKGVHASRKPGNIAEHPSASRWPVGFWDSRSLRYPEFRGESFEPLRGPVLDAGLARRARAPRTDSSSACVCRTSHCGQQASNVPCPITSISTMVSRSRAISA